MPHLNARDARMTKLTVFAGAVAILIVGTNLAPRSPTPASPLPEPATPLLDEQVRVQEPAALLRGLRDTARRAMRATVTFEIPSPPSNGRGRADWQRASPDPDPNAAAAGVTVSPEGEVLTTAAAVGPTPAVVIRLADGRTVDGRVVSFAPEHDLALIQIAPDTTIHAATLLLGSASTGQFAFAAGQTAAGEFVVPTFLGAGDAEGYTLDNAPPALPSGTGLFDLDGRALAIVGRGAGGLRAYPIGRALDRLRRLIEEHHAMPSAVGLTLQPRQPGLEPFFDAPGVIIADVTPNSPAAAAGVAAGDILQRVGGQDVLAPESGVRQLAGLVAREPVTLTVSRHGQPREIAVVPDALLEAPWVSGAADRVAPATARPASDVFAAEVLRRAAINTDTLIISVAGRPPRARSRVTRPVPVYVDDHGRRYFAVVEPPS